MKTCDVCKNKLGIMNKFKYADGYICKECYKKASRQFTETITQKSFEEIKDLCDNEYNINEEFHVTGRIGNYILIDNRNNKICVLNNRITNNKVSKPDFYKVDDILECKIISNPMMTSKELEEKVLAKDEGTIRSLKVQIQLKNKNKPAEIVFIKSDVRMKSYAFRQSYTFAKRIVEEVQKMKEES